MASSARSAFFLTLFKGGGGGGEKHWFKYIGLFLMFLKVMIYSRRIDLPKEVLHVADENLRGNVEIFIDKK